MAKERGDGRVELDILIKTQVKKLFIKILMWSQFYFYQNAKYKQETNLF